MSEENDKSGRRTPADGFAPSKPMDGRKRGDWQTRYSDPQARRAIRFDALYLAVHFLLCPVALSLLWLASREGWCGWGTEWYRVLTKYGYAWLAGLLGGTLFAGKWLYHHVARNSWHQDRRLWRLLVPHFSAGLAFAFVCVVDSGFVAILDADALDSGPSVVAFAFLVGYFSDPALAKLTELAHSLFGTTVKSVKTAADEDEGGGIPGG